MFLTPEVAGSYWHAFSACPFIETLRRQYTPAERLVALASLCSLFLLVLTLAMYMAYDPVIVVAGFAIFLAIAGFWSGLGLTARLQSRWYGDREDTVV